MTTLKLKSAIPITLFILIATSPIALFYLGIELQSLQPTMGLLDAGIWQLLLLGIIAFMGLSALTWWLLLIAWRNLGLPNIQQMVLQFNKLELWQQFAFYWASFALLLLAAVMSLIAVF